MEFLIVTGLSGAGKTRVVDICEDMDYYCVDNLPTALVGRFAELCLATGGRFERVAMAMDGRASKDPAELVGVVDELKGLDCGLRVLFIEADDKTIIRRYKESRRPHPLAKKGGTLAQAIADDRAFMAPLRALSDNIVDTSAMSLSELQNALYDLLVPERRYFNVKVSSFGFKYGIPPESDCVFDVRCLPNPFYQAELKDLCGLDTPVSDYVFGFDNSRELLEKLTDLLRFLLPRYEQEGRHQLNIAIGCTGGRHRSVAVAQALGDALAAEGFPVTVAHRDMERAYQ